MYLNYFAFCFLRIRLYKACSCAPSIGRSITAKDVVALEQFGMILSKVESHAKIARALEKTGYNSDILEQGYGFQKKAREMYTEKVSRKDEYSYTRASFLKEKKEIDHRYIVFWVLQARW